MTYAVPRRQMASRSRLETIAGRILPRFRLQNGFVTMQSAGDREEHEEDEQTSCRDHEVDEADPGSDQSRNGPIDGPREQATRAANARQKSGRRRFVDPTTSEREYTEAEMEFMLAMNEYKQQSGRMFPTWSEVLEVLRSLGYEKITSTEAIARSPATAVRAVANGPRDRAQIDRTARMSPLALRRDRRRCESGRTRCEGVDSRARTAYRDPNSWQ